MTAARSARFKRYAAYKDSGVEWLGEIPAHWGVRRLKQLASLNPESLAEDTDPGLEIVYVDIGGVDSLGRIVERDSLTFASAPSRARRLVRGGDVIVSTVRTYLRAIAPIRDPEPNMVVSTGFAVLRPADDIATDYAAYALRAPYFVERVVANSKGVSFPAINESEMATYCLAVPPAEEQRAIAAFLDRETARIDALVAKKERLIELLQEKRTALITRAVTKGLDPNVPMKDSGIEWLGEIPVHWEVRRLAMAVQKITNGYVGPTRDILVSDGTRYLQSLHIKGGTVDFDRKPYYVTEQWSSAHAKSVLREGDVLVVQTGDIGQVCAVPAEFDGCNCHALIILRLPAGLGSGFFLSLFLQSDCGQNSLRWSQTGALHPHLECGHVREIPIVLPPTSEQHAILRYVDKGAAEIDGLVAKVRDVIDRLKALRTALISAAVTGKIDVREEVSP